MAEAELIGPSPDAHRHPDAGRGEGDGGKQAREQGPVEENERSPEDRPQAHENIHDPNHRRPREPLEQVFEIALQPDPKEERDHPELGEESQKLVAPGRQQGPRVVEHPKANPDEEVSEKVGEVEVLERGLR